MKNNRKSGKIVIKNIMILFAIFTLLGTCLNIAVAKKEFVTKEYVVCQNDTLWNISSKICKKSSDKNLKIQNVIKDIKTINNLSNTDIYEGEIIKLPVY